MSIDGELEDTEGVEEANTSYAKGKTEVSFDEKKVKESDLIQTIARVGYQAAEA